MRHHHHHHHHGQPHLHPMIILVCYIVLVISLFSISSSSAPLPSLTDVITSILPASLSTRFQQWHQQHHERTTSDPKQVHDAVLLQFAQSGVVSNTTALQPLDIDSLN